MRSEAEQSEIVPSEGGGRGRRGVNPHKVWILAKREYLSRVKSKGYWIGTLVLPLLLAGLMFLPALIFSQSTSRLDLVMVDATGRLGEPVRQGLAERAEGSDGRIVDFRLTLAEPAADVEAQRAELDRRLLAEEIDAWMWVDEENLAAGEVEFRARNVSNTFSQSVLSRSLTDAARDMRLEEAGFDPATVEPLLDRVGLATFRVSDKGSAMESGEVGFLFAYGLFFLMYIVLLMWGQQVLQGVLEEKNTRVVEVIVSATTPFELMMGKLMGIGAAALTQFSLWLTCIVAFTAPGIVAAVATLPEDSGLPEVTVLQALYVLAFFVLGFFVYSSMYAAVGSAFNTLQEAQHMAAVPTFTLIAPMLFLFPVINDSGGALAVVTSLIPILSPIIMPLRIAIEMPQAWQVWLSLVLTAGFIWLMVAFCARIYRTGILMYGKKPTFRELWRWLRHA